MIAIRRLNASGAEDYRAIRLAALRGDPDAFGSTYEAEVNRPMAHFAERLAGTTVFAAYAEGRIVGMAGFAAETGPKDRHKGFVWGVYVAPEGRREGAGRGLVSAVMAHARGRVEQLTLTVTAGNEAALALYEGLGFVRYGLEPRALKSGSVYHDEILMVAFLTVGRPGSNPAPAPS